MTIVTELRKLHKTMTGKDATGQTIDEVLEELNDNYTGGDSVTVDSAMSDSSENPVQNRVITSALANKQNSLTFDSTPTANSTNPVTSDGIKAYVDANSGGATVINLEMQNNELVSDKTFGEVFNACLQGQVILKYAIDVGEAVMQGTFNVISAMDGGSDTATIVYGTSSSPYTAAVNGYKTNTFKLTMT